MGIDFVLRLADGTSPVTLPDPGSGTFDAAGDFDGVLFRSSDPLEVLSRADPYGDNIVFTHDEAEGVLRDTEILFARDAERYGRAPQGWRASSRRGLLRLREMAADRGELPNVQHGTAERKRRDDRVHPLSGRNSA
jgi:hypothetical protein